MTTIEEQSHNVSSRSTSNKALRINLDEKKYGTIAEIGAGQEVARHFFLAGAAAGTVAKTISAYDMQFSDAIYGTQEGGRYVSKSRVQAMLDKEFALVLNRVAGSRSKSSRFFSYAATVSAKSYNKNNECHAWCGIRVQMYPGAEPSEILMHIRMLDNTAEQQQESLGTLGVNLIYGAYYYYETPTRIIESLTDNLSSSRIEIDSIEFSGPYFEEIDNRAINLHLIRSEKTRAIMFKPDGCVAVPAEMLYKKNVLTIRGSFRPVTNLNVDMIEQGSRSFGEFENVNEENTMVLAEISLNDAHGVDLMVPEADLIARVGLLNALGYSVMVSSYTRYFSLRAYFRQYTRLQIGIVLGMINIKEIFDEERYEGVEGGILEGFGKLFPDNTRLFVYPELSVENEVLDFTTITVPQHLRYLYKHLLENQYIFGIECSDSKLLTIYSRDILKQMESGAGDWEALLPEGTAETIKTEGLFGYTERQESTQ
ncbi:nicotinate-nucleotide adenylyltransferase [Chromatiales bacterium (ex Bugula neritina AB1)]|nr:nicotinate-nucleotide adenylyltransferase [Chromatiales bacterium (ex Bugula neritina AB1)]